MNKRDIERNITALTKKGEKLKLVGFVTKLTKQGLKDSKDFVDNNMSLEGKLFYHALLQKYPDTAKNGRELDPKECTFVLQEIQNSLVKDRVKKNKEAKKITHENEIHN